MRAVIGSFVALTLAVPVAAQSPSPPRGTLFSSEAGSVVAEGSVSLGTYAMTDLFWDLARETGAPEYEPDKLFARGSTSRCSASRRSPARAAAGVPDVVERLRKSDNVHIDGVNNLAHGTSGAPSARNVVFRALMQSLEQFPPRQKSGTLRMAGD